MTCKKEPELAVKGVLDWVRQERKDRLDREVREAGRKARRDANNQQQVGSSFARMGVVSPPPPPTTTTTTTTFSTAVEATSVGQQLPLEPSTPGTPFMDLAGIAEEARQHVEQRLGLTFGSIDDEDLTSHPSGDKPVVNGTMESGFITPPGT